MTISILMAARRNTKKPSLGVLFWIAVVLLTLAIFLSNRRNIQQALERSGLRQIIAERSTKIGDDSVEIVEAPPELPEGEPAVAEQLPSEEVAAIAVPADSVQEERPGETAVAKLQSATEDEEDKKIALQETAIYFISVEQGQIAPVNVSRKVRRAAPMTHTLQWLIQGPTQAESEKGLLNLIPPTSRLLSASVKNGVAYINFNEDFRYNNFGAEGTLAQLQQIVFSVTEYSSIQQVQILINGERVDYLQSESPIYIGKPIGREIFG